MDLFKQIDFYCERTDPSYWSEPINAISNLAFIFVGLFYLIKYKNGLTNWSKFFAVLTISIGIGSYLFHTHANNWSLIADVAPITLFIGTFLFYTFKVIYPVNVFLNLLVTVFFVVGGILMEGVNFGLNGSESYLHAIFLICSITIFLKYKKLQVYRLYFQSTLIFLVSLSFRTLDNSFCHLNPIGTHFLWHILNAILLFNLIKISTTKRI